jgi:hypothetical protein
MKRHLINSVLLLKRLPPTLRQNRFRFFRPFDEARLLVTAQNSLPKMSSYPFYLFVH